MTNDFDTALRAVLASLATGAALSACGGGGSDGNGSATVASAAVGTPMYGQKLVLTLAGTHLAQGVTVTASGCDNVALDASKSGASTAQYTCSVSAIGSGQFQVTSPGGTVLNTTPFTVPEPQVTLDFSNGAAVSGSVVLTLAPDKTPITVNNFLSYVNSGFYVGTVFHRVSPGFAVQGGGYTAPLDANDQNLKPTHAPIALEVGKGLSNTQWTIAMARASDPASATSQFFINLVDNSGTLDPGLSAGYAAFGSVTSGMADVQAIAGAPCVADPTFLFLKPGDCTPTPDMVITSATQTR
jgi:cyclophilin family peptidyl-prolyl cis-trans isomerase